MKRRFTKYPQNIMGATYNGIEFDNRQMKYIQKGLEEGVDVSLYADPKFSAEQMSEILIGLEQGVDISWYADPKFNFRQMGEIREGLLRGLDVSICAKPEISWQNMDRILNPWKYEYEIPDTVSTSKVAPFDSTSETVVNGIASGLNVSTEVAKYLADFYEEDGGPEVVEIDNEEEYIDFIVDVAKERFEEILLNEGPDGVIEYEGKAGAKKFFEVARALGIDPEDYRL